MKQKHKELQQLKEVGYKGMDDSHRDTVGRKRTVKEQEIVEVMEQYMSLKPIGSSLKMHLIPQIERNPPLNHRCKHKNKKTLLRSSPLQQIV